jgi:hypothetical protein
MPHEGPSTIWMQLPKPWSAGPYFVNKVYGNYS